MQRQFYTWWFHLKRTFPERVKWLIGSLLGVSFLCWFFTTQSPEQGSAIAIAIVVVTIIVGSSIQFLFNNVRRSGIICVGVGAFLTLRVLKLADPLYFILLVLFLTSLELSLRNR